MNAVQENIYCKNCMECINVVCGHNVGFNVNLEAHIQMTRLHREIVRHLLRSCSINS